MQLVWNSLQCRCEAAEVDSRFVHEAVDPEFVRRSGPASALASSMTG
jgi:hypothetical protein